MTDANGNTATGTITVNIIDDVPTAHVDSGNVNEGALLTVAASGVLANDVAGADGFTAGGGVVGVRAAGGDLTTDVTTGVGTAIAGQHGTLHLNADGSYTYQSTANNITADTTDVFVYTVKDGDGDLSTTTLTINLANVTLSATDTDALVNEAGLPVIGSDRGIEQRDLQRFDHAVRRHRPVHLCADQPGDGQPRHAGAERRDRDLHLYADLTVRHARRTARQRRRRPSRTRTASATR